MLQKISPGQAFDESRLCRFVQTLDDGSTLELGAPAMRHPARITMLLREAARMFNLPKPNYATMSAGNLRVEYL